MALSAGRATRSLGREAIERVRFALDSYHKDISVRASLFDQANVTGVQQIENAAREYDVAYRCVSTRRVGESIHLEKSRNPNLCSPR